MRRVNGQRRHQPVFGLLAVAFRIKNLGATCYDYVQRRGKVILISTRMVMVFGCWVTIWNPFFSLSFFTIVATWAGFDFWAYWLDYTYFIPPSLQHARRFTKYPAGIYAAFAHTIIIISSQSLSLSLSATVCSCFYFVYLEYQIPL